MPPLMQNANAVRTEPVVYGFTEKFLETIGIIIQPAVLDRPAYWQRPVAAHLLAGWGPRDRVSRGDTLDLRK